MTATPTLREAQRMAEARLREAGIESPELDARLLVQHALGLTRERLMIQARAMLTLAMVDRIMALVERRAAREPVSRILGRREFWSLELRLDPSTLDPRPDTETVVEAALSRVADRRAPLRVLDLGTGTGCILLALLSELPAATGLGVDVQPAAVATAAANAARLHLDGRAAFRHGDWAAGIDERFDLVVSNPPYIPDGDIAGLAPEVRAHDPLPALAGGPDGLDAYRALAPEMQRLLAPGGAVALEVGQGQDAAVAALLAAQGLRDVRVKADLNGIGRCVHALAPEPPR
ncbi:peptide chain release factor N(5)-glutamine methyltransferase [Arenibaculum pallidiluteum]|uniref:peptide chain release factor N(5)-glutamine methyltransferase n=1 Tax=Arenibaculum pallidiluteum TaxID=2812559 RepID=UPI001A9627D6|nr:peptide chain release factor N(5)-glutamine methyltransferase [Arenibaculum pallidiluteum]